jgi:hypothetical protein
MSLAPPRGLPRRAHAELRGATIAIEWPRRLFACEDLCELARRRPRSPPSLGPRAELTSSSGIEPAERT